MSNSDIGPLNAPRRGISISALLLSIILAGISGGIAWGVYGNEVRSKLGILPDATPTAAALPAASSGTSANDEMVALLRGLQASQKHTADQLETALQLLTSEQASSKAMDDAVAALSAKIDKLQLQRPMVTAAKKPAPAALPKPPALAQPPAVVSPAPDEPEPSETSSLRR
jgi:hypothetical protein